MEDSPIYREGGNRWFASAPSKETLQKWFSKKDLEELVSKGFTISEFEVVGCKKVSDFEYIFTRDNIINRNYLEVSDIYPELKDFAPKVEPKFHEGDWVILTVGGMSATLQITNVDINKYWFNDGCYLPFADEKCLHLWTIKDAKEGDVLFLDLMGGETFIYNGINPNMAILYSFIINNNGEDVLPYHIGKPNVGIGNIEEVKNIIRPATKEQIDLLFQKMKESGYEWNTDKKGLKKL
mgnify:CR=1 FL=1